MTSLVFPSDVFTVKMRTVTNNNDVMTMIDVYDNDAQKLFLTADRCATTIPYEAINTIRKTLADVNMNQTTRDQAELFIYSCLSLEHFAIEFRD